MYKRQIRRLACINMLIFSHNLGNSPIIVVLVMLQSAFLFSSLLLWTQVCAVVVCTVTVRRLPVNVLSSSSHGHIVHACALVTE